MAEIKVYHGSNCEVKTPLLSYGREDALIMMRKETNDIVEKILKDKVRDENEKPGPPPLFRRKRGR